MELRTIGESGLGVTPVAMGCWPIVSHCKHWPIDEPGWPQAIAENITIRNVEPLSGRGVVIRLVASRPSHTGINSNSMVSDGA